MKYIWYLSLMIVVKKTSKVTKLCCHKNNTRPILAQFSDKNLYEIPFNSLVMEVPIMDWFLYDRDFRYDIVNQGTY